jgi:hypothetical protein
MGGVEAAVLDGVGRVITNEGLGLGGTEETAIVVGEEEKAERALVSRCSDTVALQPALNTESRTRVYCHALDAA